VLGGAGYCSFSTNCSQILDFRQRSFPDRWVVHQNQGLIFLSVTRDEQLVEKLQYTSPTRLAAESTGSWMVRKGKSETTGERGGGIWRDKRCQAGVKNEQIAGGRVQHRRDGGAD
jgi:hypothetical protein